MTEHFLVYNKGTGDVLWRGSGNAGTAAQQELPEGQSALVVGAELWASSPLDIAGMRALRWEQVKAIREAVRSGGCLTPAGAVDTQPDSLILITAMVQAASIALAAGDTLVVDWTMQDNSVASLDAPTIIAVGRAVALFVVAVQAYGTTLRNAIGSAATAEAVLAIDITTGWPAT